MTSVAPTNKTSLVAAHCLSRSCLDDNWNIKLMNRIASNVLLTPVLQPKVFHYWSFTFQIKEYAHSISTIPLRVSSWEAEGLLPHIPCSWLPENLNPPALPHTQPSLPHTLPPYPSESVAEKQKGCSPTSPAVGCQKTSIPQSCHSDPGEEFHSCSKLLYIPKLDRVVISLILKNQRGKP